MLTFLLAGKFIKRKIKRCYEENIWIHHVIAWFLIATSFNMNEKKIVSVRMDEGVVVVVVVGSLKMSPSFMVLELEREKCPLFPVMSQLRSWRDVRRRWGWRIRNQSGIKLFALLMMRLRGLLLFAEVWAKLGMIFPCLKRKALCMLMRRRNMWMSLEAVPQCIVVWSLRASPAESRWAMLSCTSQVGFLILLASPWVSFYFVSSSLSFSFLALTYILDTIWFFLKLVLSVRTVSWRWHQKFFVFGRMIPLENLLVVRSVPVQFSLKCVDRYFK